MSFLNGLAEIFMDSALSALGAGFQAMEDPQSFLKDDLPSDANSVAKWIQSRNRRACRQHARNEAAGAYSDLGALRRPRYERVCRPYLDSIGEGPTSEGSYGPPFSGGQCPVKYSVTATGTYTQSNQCTNPDNPFQTLNWSFSRSCSDAFGIYGPIGAPYLDIQEPGTGLYSIWLPCRDGAGNPSIVQLKANHCAAKGGWTLTSLTATRCDGLTDNCGDPPNEYQPPGYPPLPPIGPPDTDNPPPGGDGKDDVEVDEDGNIRICENGDCSSPTSPGGGGDPSEDPGEEDGDPQENDPNNPQDGDITGCASEGQILTGLKIEITQTPPAEVPGAGGLYRKVCWVWMGPTQDQLDLVADGRYLEDGQFVIPDSNNCRCYKVRPSPLWGLRVQAFSRPEKED